MKDKIIEYLRGVRMVSVGNLAERLDMSVSELVPLLEALEREESLRFG